MIWLNIFLNFELPFSEIIKVMKCVDMVYILLEYRTFIFKKKMSQMSNCSAGLNADLFAGLEFISRQFSREGIQMTKWTLSGKLYLVEKLLLVECKPLSSEVLNSYLVRTPT